MDMERHRVDAEACSFSLASPLELRVEVRVELVYLLAVQVIRLCGNKTDGRVVESLFVVVDVLFDILAL